MDKKALQTYAVWAKENLENQIEVQLKALGINSESDIKVARKVGDRTIIDGDPNSYPGDLKDKRDQIINIIKQDGYKQVIEEFAYTWFNRIVTLRFMEVHDFLPHGFRVLSSRTGGFEPEIMKNLNFVKDDLRLDMSILSPLMEQGKIDEAYRYVLFRQCNALSGILPMLFSLDQSYLELLLPNALLKGETFITKLLEIDESNFLNDVEVIGWLYQFYISQKKDEVFASKKTITKDTLPAVTQLFTPDWIVRYMAENSVGRIWLESYPDSSLRASMKYYVDDAKQEEDVQKKLDAIKYKTVNPEEIKIIEPCCGSGHILVYVFDLLYKMYEEKGYQTRDIPTLILKNNLFGLDVDKRAAQLASFALIMKARSANSRFFNSNYYLLPQVYEIWDSRALIHTDYLTQIKETKLLSEQQIKDIEWLVEKFKYGKTIGSLLKVEKKDFESIAQSIDTLKEKAVLNIFNTNFLNDGIDCLRHLLKQAEIMANKYDVMITNPPYIGTSTMEPEVKKYAADNYPNSKSDMFAMFMEVPLVKKNGFRAMINMHSWMFLSSYEKLRKKIIMNELIVNMIHLGAHAFEMIGGEVVQTTSFVLRNSPIATNGVYFRLVDEKDKEAAFLGGGGIIMNISCYNSIPGNVISYWASVKLLSIFKKGATLESMASPKKGLSTGNNDLFLRFWFETSLQNLCLDATDYIYAMYTGKKWFPINKGGLFRKWYGNNEYVVNYKNNGKELLNYKGAILRNSNYYFGESLTWTDLSTGSLSVRYNKRGFIHDVAGPCIFDLKDKACYLISLLNSKVSEKILELTAATLHFNVGNIADFPVVFRQLSLITINNISIQNIQISKSDWDSFETSWDFKKHPLI